MCAIMSFRLIPTKRCMTCSAVYGKPSSERSSASIRQARGSESTSTPSQSKISGIDRPEARTAARGRSFRSEIAGQGAAMIGLDVRDHVLQAHPDEAVHDLFGGVREAKLGEKLGVDPAGEGLGVDQHAVAVEDQRHRSPRSANGRPGAVLPI